jgi:hypothetical protein
MDLWLTVGTVQIVNSFPDGWMTSGQISREGTSTLLFYFRPSFIFLTSTHTVSILKKRVEKEAMEIEGVL